MNNRSVFSVAKRIGAYVKLCDYFCRIEVNGIHRIDIDLSENMRHMTISSYCTFRSAGCNVFIADDIIYADGKILRYRREIYRFDICPVQIQRHTVAGGENTAV